MKRPRQYRSFIEAYSEQGALGKSWIAFFGLMWVLRIEFTRLAVVCFSWNIGKWRRWWPSVAITRLLALLVLPLPYHPMASVEEQQSAKGRGQRLLGIQGTFSLWSNRHLLFLPTKQKPPGSLFTSTGLSSAFGDAVLAPQAHKQSLHPGVGWSLQLQKLQGLQYLINAFVLDTF